MVDQSEEEKLRQKYISQCSRPNYRRHLPPGLHGLVGEYCSKPFQQQLKQSDLSSHQMRLLLEKSHAKEYLSPLLSGSQVEEIENSGVLVYVYDREENMYEMKFKRWGQKAYVLTSQEWLRFRDDHDFILGENLNIWMFKHAHMDSKLCFAIVPEREMNAFGFGVMMNWLKEKLGLLFGCFKSMLYW